MRNRKSGRIKEKIMQAAVVALIISAVWIVGRMDAQDEIAKNDPCVYFQK